jgi:hypothetical protein
LAHRDWMQSIEVFIDYTCRYPQYIAMAGRSNDISGVILALVRMRCRRNSPIGTAARVIIAVFYSGLRIQQYDRVLLDGRSKHVVYYMQ